MNSKLFAEIEEAIDTVIEKYGESGPLWDGWIHETLTRQMATAAALVFDASMDGQEYAKREGTSL